MNGSQTITDREITALGLSFPDPNDWLPLNDHSGRACEVSIDASGAPHELVWLFLNYVLHVCGSHGRAIASIGLPDDMYRGLDVFEPETTSFNGHHLSPSSIRLGCDDHLFLMLEGGGNDQSPLPSPKSWLPRGTLGTRGCSSTIDICGINVSAATAFLVDVIDLCRKRDYVVDAVRLPWDPRTAYPSGMPLELQGIDWVADDWSPLFPRLGLEFHQC